MAKVEMQPAAAGEQPVVPVVRAWAGKGDVEDALTDGEHVHFLGHRHDKQNSAPAVFIQKFASLGSPSTSLNWAYDSYTHAYVMSLRAPCRH